MKTDSAIYWCGARTLAENALRIIETYSGGCTVSVKVELVKYKYYARIAGVFSQTIYDALLAFIDLTAEQTKFAKSNL